MFDIVAGMDGALVGVNVSFQHKHGYIRDDVNDTSDDISESPL